ncbi:PAS domain-containing sensor histidine kinase [Halorubrum sp. DTA46]|uniref:PAS domain-containing sensor histidine kinase n=1 Tax=Halorubrum sp. DTA46 TaxID=3402162 RepID=UPI003AAB0CC5
MGGDQGDGRPSDEGRQLDDVPRDADFDVAPDEFSTISPENSSSDSSSPDVSPGDASAPPALRSFVEAIPTPTLACDPDTRAIRAANAPATDLLDRDAATLTLMGLTDIGESLTTVDGEAVDEVVDAAVEEDGVTRFEWNVRDSRGRFCLSVSVRTAEISNQGWLVVGLTDVTDRVRAEESAQSQLRVLDAIASTTTDALFQCTVDGTLARWNERLASDTGYAAEELTGTTLTALVDEESRDAVAEALQSVYRRGEVTECEASLFTRSGERVPYRFTLGPIVGGDDAVGDETGDDAIDGDEVVGAVGIGEDMTESSLREERLAVLTRVLRHNFRNDLNVVTGFTQHAISEVDDPDLARDLERVVATADRLLRLGETSRRVERLLADRPTPRSVRLADAVDEALVSFPSELRERADIAVDVPDKLTVSAVGYLAEAITELVDNAIRHNDAERPWVRISAAELPSESWTSLVIADDGPGIPPTERSVLTGEETPLEHASGLGLWYVNWIVTAGGGSFDIRESKAGGTRIEVELRTLDDE